MSAPAIGRLRVRVEGTVQGVGFRPFVYRLAHEESVTGWVRNDERGVVLEIEGPFPSLERLLARLTGEPPPLAAVDRVAREPVATEDSRTFEIRASTRGDDVDAVIAADSATCADCLRELLDPRDRRYRYPFINCTNCGPRLTIIEGVPYDRAQTTMSTFVMCEACQREYRDPANRRFHAQPNACPVCGPRAELVGATAVDAVDPVDAAAGLLEDGAILAVKGIGGYHLACDARNEAAVRRLRDAKHREEKPFALMVGGVTQARALIAVGAAEERLLASPARPIVLSPRRDGDAVAAVAPGASAAVAPAVAPGAPELGVMLAYTPLHHLLLADVSARQGRPAVLVMTSGNVSDEPIAYEDGDAVERLGGIADGFLRHNRPIRTRVDDSIARVVGGAREVPGGREAGGRPQVLRRSRGYVPAPLALVPAARRPLLACGAELKSTFCLARGARAWISHHIGDLEHYPARASFREGVAHWERLFDVRPEVIVHDVHPGYASTAYAVERAEAAGLALIGVQHHHAHLAGCLAEHGCAPDARAVGAIYDGTGYGLDGTVWGGEILVGGPAAFERVAALRAVRMPGGEAAIRQPWRMALAWLHETDGAAARGGAGDAPRGVPPAVPPRLADRVDERRWRAVARVAADPQLSPLTTSMGRLFDAVGALCGIAPEVSYEGQAAIELAAAASAAAARGITSRRYELALVEPAAAAVRWTLDPTGLVAAVAADAAAGIAVEAIAAGFHGAVAEASARVCALVAGEAGLDTVVLSGGVFQNRGLLDDLTARLEAGGLRVLSPERLPPNDGGIAYGQAAVAAARDALD